MYTTATNRQNIVNPSKWIGKSVIHMANWRDFQWNETYCVCEWTKKLMLVKDEAYYGDYFETKQEAEAAGYDECYYYSEEGLMKMWQGSNQQVNAA